MKCVHLISPNFKNVSPGNQRDLIASAIDTRFTVYRGEIIKTAERGPTKNNLNKINELKRGWPGVLNS